MFTAGQSVEWDDSRGTHHGKIISEGGQPGYPNTLQHWVIRVDSQCWLRACHTAREKTSQTVSRSVILHNLRAR